MSGAVRKRSDMTGLRIRLRRERDGDAEFVAALKGALPGCEGESAERLIVERRGNGEVIGLVEFSRGEPRRGWATFGAIVMADGEPGWGYGSETVRLIEDELGSTAKVGRFRAMVPKSMGLAFYFWLRQGYSPAAPEEVFWPDEGKGDMIWMVRQRSQ